jgi:hypothetical protein
MANRTRITRKKKDGSNTFLPNYCSKKQKKTIRGYNKK